MIEPDDDDGHVVAAVLTVVADRLCTAHVQDLLAHLGQHDLVALRHCRAVGQLVLDVRDHLLVGHGVPHPVGSNDDELPARVELEALNLRHGADDLLPGRFLVLGLEQEVAEASSRDQNSTNPIKEDYNLNYLKLYILVYLKWSCKVVLN